MLATSLLASFAALSSVAALPSQLVGRDNQPPCVPALSNDTYNIYISGSTETGWEYVPGSPASVSMTAISWMNTTYTNITYIVTPQDNNGNTISPNGGSDSTLCLTENTNSTLLTSGACSSSDAILTIGCQTCSSHFATGCFIVSNAVCVVDAGDNGTPLGFTSCTSPQTANQLFDFTLS
ncbi:hypothetical protein RQP46_005764 [Phenoliferia psychrophenolica]